MRGRQSNVFSQVPRAEIPRSVFSRSHCYKTTFDAGYLIPFYVDEALPGDTFNCRVSLFARLATPLAPIMDNMYLETFFFAVPNRLLWDNWQRFCGEQPDPGDSTDFLVPRVETGGTTFQSLSMGDYFGLPTGIVGVAACALWFRAYNLIYNEWFRDQNLQDRAEVPKGDGPDSVSQYPLRRRGKRHDYFTSALPWPQKGPGVELPLGTLADVVRDSAAAVPGFEATDAGATIRQLTFQTGAASPTPVGTTVAWGGGANMNVNTPIRWGTDVGLFADLSTATAVTINALREAVTVQRLLERDARGGTRYTEIVKSHFGVTSPDARLQRPEFLGGGSSPVNISPIVQQSSTVGINALGDLGGVGTVGAVQHGFTKSFVEHSVIIGLMAVRADLTYQQGMPRMFSRRTRYDFYWPDFAHLGEQAILNKEIYTQGTADDDLVFGYQERHAEYRHFPSQITGRFRSTLATPLDFWHLAQEFSTLPTLSGTFIEDTPPMSRVKAVTSEPDFIFDSYFDIRTARPMPIYAVPGLDRL